jgi:hypothetical protein
VFSTVYCNGPVQNSTEVLRLKAEVFHADGQTNATNTHQQNLVKGISDKVCHVSSHALQYCSHAWKKRQDPSYEMSRSRIDSAARLVKQSNGNFYGGRFEEFLSDREDRIKKMSITNHKTSGLL